VIVEAVPLSPWSALGYAVGCLAVGLLSVWLLVRTRNRAHARVGYTGYRTPWWRLRLTTLSFTPLAPGAIMMFCWSIAFITYALFEWTDAAILGVLCVLCVGLALGGMLYYAVEWARALFTKNHDDWI